MVGTVYIAAPSGYQSGGPELCHQFANMLNEWGYKSKICYYTADGEFVDSEIPDTYVKYQVETESDIKVINRAENVLVIAETAFCFFNIYDFKCKVAFWWMSVDNFLDTMGLNINSDMRQPRFDIFRGPDFYHFVQSEYARDYVLNKVGAAKENVFWMSDYISDAFRAGERIPVDMKRDWIAFNPKKGYDIIYPIMQRHPQWNWVPLINMKPEQVALSLQVAKVYVDFGQHPGKDRIPREAVMSGACIITNKKGSAAYQKDVPIDECYKFEDPAGMEEELVALIGDIFANYPEHRKNFDEYRQIIIREKEVFAMEVKTFMDRIDG